jgi:NADPH:quinone reductase-like Zn-dependent oxidoreductase
MKAAVIFQGRKMPQFTDGFPEPVVVNEDQVIILVKATAIKQLDKSRASGEHYSSTGDLDTAKVPGGDGVGLLPDGTRIYALGITGMMAEKAVVEKSKMIKVPGGIDNVTAAALPNAVAGSAMALRFRAEMKGGETILINGATGFTGKIAVQIARFYGAGKIIVTGRNEQTLQSLLALGADEIVPVKQDTDSFVSQIRNIHRNTPIDIVLDYLWGETAELILEALKGKGAFTPKTRFISIGSLMGDKISLSSQILRSVDLQLSGSGLGSWTKQEMQKLITEIIPQMFQLAAENKLKVDTVTVELKDIEKIWDKELSGGKRLVVTI